MKKRTLGLLSLSAISLATFAQTASTDPVIMTVTVSLSTKANLKMYTKKTVAKKSVKNLNR